LSADDFSSVIEQSYILILKFLNLGKSQMLLAATQLAARSVYVGGNTSSTTGLTVSLTKEERGETGIEAGALVLADQGICAIDEFDKMAKNHQDGKSHSSTCYFLVYIRKSSYQFPTLLLGLLEAMEQQQVSIAKAGIVASLPARCSVAAANPKHGSYDMSRTVAENLNMAKPILSRFDLVFILRDRADKELDRLVSSNIMNLYRSSDRRALSSTSGLAHSLHPVQINGLHESGISNENDISIVSGPKDPTKMPISKRLAWVCEIQKQPLPADLVRDYIAYAREYCKPKMTAEAATVLKDYYMELRYVGSC
jgi:DNA helicase MCM8